MKIVKYKNKEVYEKRLVAFVDILGFRAMVEDSRIDTTIRRRIKKAMTVIQKSVNTQVNNTTRKVTTFSDSAVLSYAAEQHSSLLYLLLDIIHLQLQLGSMGIMIRGGMAYGDCYHDGKVVFGPAMNEAYYLESEVAKWPRVVVPWLTLKKAIEVSTDHSNYVYQREVSEIMGCLKKDIFTEREPKIPELYFIDYLSQSHELVDYGDEYLEWLRRYRIAIIDGLNKYSTKNMEIDIPKAEAKKIFDKYRYTLQYWNSVVGDAKAVMPVPHLEFQEQKEFMKLYQKLVISKRYPYH